MDVGSINNLLTQPVVLGVVLGALVVIAIVVSYRKYGESVKDSKEETSNGSGNSEKEHEPKIIMKSQKNSRKKKETWKAKKDDFTHEWLINLIKGHTTQLSDFDISPNGKFIVCCDHGRNVSIWNIKDPENRNHHFMMETVGYDSAKLVKFTPNSKSFVCCMERNNALRVFKFSTKDNGTPFDLKRALEEDLNKTMDDALMTVGTDSVGRYMMTCNDNTRIDILAYRGNLLHTINTGVMYNNQCLVSPCGRFVAAVGFTPDAKIWEVCFDKSGQFVNVKRAFDLKGHNAGILSISINNDSSRMATASKDGTWKLWRTAVEYKLGQDPECLATGKFHCPGSDNKVLIRLSPDALTLCIAVDDYVHFYNTVTTKLDNSIEQHFGTHITQMKFNPDGSHLYVAGDKRVRVFRNITGLRATICKMQSELSHYSQSQSSKRRLNESIAQAREKLEAWSCSD